MGIRPELYTAMITSGELARRKLSQRTEPFDEALGQRCLLLSSDRDRSIIDGLAIERVPTVGEADFILLAGVDDSLPRAYYQATFELGCARRLPLICANPDLIRFTEHGMMPSAGEFARLYEELGGRVHYLGKPYPEIYATCLAQYGCADLSRTIAVGDSWHHDICGGVRAGLATAFVLDGIHRHEFAGLDTPLKRRERLKELARDYGAAPDWAIPQFRW
jgi:HAD superfamily hydrolase (TIGR01459 family)